MALAMWPASAAVRREPRSSRQSAGEACHRAAELLFAFLLVSARRSCFLILRLPRRSRAPCACSAHLSSSGSFRSRAQNRRVQRVAAVVYAFFPLHDSGESRRGVRFPSLVGSSAQRSSCCGCAAVQPVLGRLCMLCSHPPTSPPDPTWPLVHAYIPAPVHLCAPIPPAFILTARQPPAIFLSFCWVSSDHARTACFDAFVSAFLRSGLGLEAAIPTPDPLCLRVRLCQLRCSLNVG